MDPAAEHTTAPAMKMTDVMSNIFLRPNRSERLPPVIAVTAAPTKTELTASPCSNVERPKVFLIKISAPEMTPVSIQTTIHRSRRISLPYIRTVGFRPAHEIYGL
jgi:hypothetical protein